MRILHKCFILVAGIILLSYHVLSDSIPYKENKTLDIGNDREGLTARVEEHQIHRRYIPRETTTKKPAAFIADDVKVQPIRSKKRLVCGPHRCFLAYE